MNALRRLAGGAATACALFALAVPTYADGMRGSIKDKPEPRRCTFSANVALTTEYVFRGYSQSAEGPAVQGGFDATCGIFYAGVWASSLDFDGGNFGTPSFDGTVVGLFDASIEIDTYAGVKFNTGKVAWDVGVIYYGYPQQKKYLPGTLDLPYFELKVGASGEVWKGGTLGATVFYSPDYQLESGETWTFEGTFAQTLPTLFTRITPTFSALIGYQINEGTASYKFSFGNGTDNYTYWNAGVTFALDKNWSVDVRYWDTNLEDKAGGSAYCHGQTFQCDERVVGTLKFTY
jgi:uncharacterized protein (TIGR02001 family)